MLYPESHRHEDARELRRAKESGVSEEAYFRLLCVLCAQKEGIGVAAKYFGKNRATVAGWMQRYIPGHPESLEARPTTPHTVRERQTDPAVVEAIKKLRTADAHINRTAIRSELMRMFDGSVVPSESTIGRILKSEELTMRDLLQNPPMPARADDASDTDATGAGIVGLAATLLIGVAMSIFAFAGVPQASAANIGPQTHVYNGRLLDSSGNAVTSSTSVRFSYWKSEDYQSGDVTGTGAINTAVANYGSWFEVHTVTPDSNGYFSLEMGSVTALPSIASYSVGDLADLFLQVEVKAAAAANTAYELLDVNTSSATVDRSPILSVPFALNADLLDQHDVGTGSGSIPVLGSGGVLPIAEVPGATNKDAFTLDNNNTATTDISLQFGQALAKKLSYDIVNSQFNFNDSVNIEGDLTVTGLINGVDITDLNGSDTYLKASSGAGLNLSVGGGSYRVNGDITTFSGSGGVGLRANATQNVYFTGTGLTVTTGALPDDKSFIPVAQVTTSTGGITAITDLRVLSSDNREQTVEKNFHPGYENTSYQADASNNVGQLYITHDAISGNNFYMWTSSKPTSQDYDLYVRITLSPDFTEWSGVPLQIGYRSTNASNANNALTIQVYDTNGQPVSLGGSASGLASTSWTSTDLTFGAGATWTPGSEFLIKFTMQAKDGYQIHLGKMRLRYVDLLSE